MGSESDDGRKQEAGAGGNGTHRGGLTQARFRLEDEVVGMTCMELSEGAIPGQEIQVPVRPHAIDVSR